MERTPGLDAEWDRNRAEEEPVMWDLAQADKLTDPDPEPDAELGGPGYLPGETTEEMISRVCAEVREGPPPRQNAGGPGCWRTEEPVAYPPDDLAGHPRPGTGVPETDVLDVIAGEILAIGRTHGWDNFGKMVEQLKKEGL